MLKNYMTPMCSKDQGQHTSGLCDFLFFDVQVRGQADTGGLTLYHLVTGPRAVAPDAAMVLLACTAQQETLSLAHLPAVGSPAVHCRSPMTLLACAVRRQGRCRKQFCWWFTCCIVLLANTNAIGVCGFRKRKQCRKQFGRNCPGRPVASQGVGSSSACL
jgi:hypothetical protein